MTKDAGGNERNAVLNAHLSSFVGIILSPALVLSYLIYIDEVDKRGKTTLKMCMKVLIPLALG